MTTVSHADLEDFYAAELQAASPELFRTAFIDSLSAFTDADTWRHCVDIARTADRDLALRNTSLGGEW